MQRETEIEPGRSEQGDDAALSRAPGLRRGTGVALFGLLALTVAIATFGLLELRSHSREEALADFHDRVETGSRQLQSLMSQTLPSLGNAFRIAAIDGSIDEGGRLGEVAGTPKPVWAIGDHGQVVSSTPGAPAPPKRFVQAVIAGQAVVSGAVQEQDGSVIRLAVPVSGARGLAGAVITYPLGFAQSFVRGAVVSAPLLSGYGGVITDRRGQILALTAINAPAAKSLAEAAVGGSSGEIEVDGESQPYASQELAGIPWIAALTAPEHVIFHSTEVPGGWFAWVVLVAYAITGVLGILLLMRVLRDSQRIERFGAVLQRRRAEAERATRAKDEFISVVAHELRTPLAAIRMLTGLIRSDEEHPISPAQRRNLDDISASTDHLLTLLEDTMDISRVEQGRLQLKPERISLAALAIGVVDGLQPLADEREVELTLDVDARIGEVYIDPARLRQVMINFVTNGLKFTRPGGSVRMRITRFDPASFLVAVEDTGIGIGEEDLETLFTPTGRRTKPLREQDATRGFGLVLTKRLVEAMGGRIGVESELGFGSTFYAVLPRVEGAGRSRAWAGGAKETSLARFQQTTATSAARRFSRIGARTGTAGRRGGNAHPVEPAEGPAGAADPPAGAADED